MLKLSIIVPVYNTEKYLHRCIESLLDQDLSPDEYEIILIDDGSTDSSPKICDEYAEKYPQIKTSHQENRGVSTSRNLGIENAGGKYIAFVDSDDWVERKSLVQILNECERKNLDVCIYKMTVETVKGEKAVAYNHNFENGKIYIGKDVIIGGFCIGSACIATFSRAFLNSNKVRFKEGMQYSEDVLFVTATLAKAERVSFLAIAPYRYAYNGSSMTNSIDRQKSKVMSVVEFSLELQRIANVSKDNQLSEYINRWINSIVLGQIVSLRSNENRTLLMPFIDYAHKNGAYPIKGRTLSWKTTLLVPFVNCWWLMRRLTRR